ncbi:uncharacterized protein LOC144860532 [Branchiostoma floridae x Branchiostoma japonicum]
MADQSELALYETMFQERFTEEDAGFQAHLQKPTPAPPIVESWSSRSRRNFDNRSQRGGRSEGWRGGRNEGWREGRNEGWRGGRNEGWREGRDEGWRGGWRGGRNEGWREGGGSRDRREGYHGHGRDSRGNYQGGYDRYQGRDRPYH